MKTKQRRELVHVRVIKHLPQGLFVELDNGERGIIRTREISLDEGVASNWKSQYPIDWDGYAATLPSKNGEVREFSLSRVEHDPWEELLGEGFDREKVFDGVVTGVFEYGAFIEISPGVSGLLHKSQVAPFSQTPLTELFWYGDKVLVVIQEVNSEAREISLGLAPSGYLSNEEMLTGKTQAKSTPEAKSRVEKIIEAKIPRRHILVVEDDPSQSEAVCGWLNEMNQSAYAVNSAEEAIAYLKKTLPDIVLADVGLPAMNGIDLARYILEHYQQVQMVNTTNWARASEVSQELDDLHAQGGKLLYKPLLPEDLAAYLLYEQDQRAAPAVLEEKLPLPEIEKMDSRKAIHALLSTGKKHLGADQLILFMVDTARRHVHIVERTTEATTRLNSISQLIYSPVRDVAEDRKVVVLNELADRDRKRFQYLIEFAPSMSSCIGLPVPIQTSEKYALFVLERRPKQFSEDQQMYLQGLALAIGAALDGNTLRERSAAMQRTAMIGNLATGMMHEISNLAGPLLYGSNALRKKMGQIEKGHENPNYPAINEDIGKIQEDVRRLINTTKAFHRIAEKGRDEILKVDEIIDETLKLLEDISDSAKVAVYFERPKELLVVRSQAVILEQIILNVALNAIQQIAEFRPNIKGRIQISMQLTKEAKQDTRCRVFIEDNGPGIHTKLWEKVFEAGYTTRREGSGIGLYISRNLMRDVGGEIYISKSRILSGTTFVLEFPVHL